MPRISEQLQQVLTEAKKWKKFQLKRLYPGMYYGEGWFTDKNGRKLILTVTIGRRDYHNKKSQWYLEAEKHWPEDMEKGWPGSSLHKAEDAELFSYKEARKYMEFSMKGHW